MCRYGLYTGFVKKGKLNSSFGIQQYRIENGFCLILKNYVFAMSFEKPTTWGFVAVT